MKMLPEKSVTSYCVQFENEPDKLNDYWDKKFSHTDKIDFALASVIGVLSFSLNEILIGRFSQAFNMLLSNFSLSKSSRSPFFFTRIKGVVSIAS